MEFCRHLDHIMDLKQKEMELPDKNLKKAPAPPFSKHNKEQPIRIQIKVYHSQGKRCPFGSFYFEGYFGVFCFGLMKLPSIFWFGGSSSPGVCLGVDLELHFRVFWEFYLGKGFICIF